MKRKITIDGKTKEHKVRNEDFLRAQINNPPKVYRNKKKYTRKIKHKGVIEE